MTEAVEGGSSSTTTMVISSKEAGSKRTVVDDLCLTVRSPMGWVLLLLLLVTWSCVAIVLFDLLDYKTLAEYTSYCDDPCLPPGLHQASSDLLKVESREPTDWLNLLLTFASSLVAPEDEEVEVIHTEEL